MPRMYPLRESIGFGSGSRVTRSEASGEIIIHGVKFLGNRSANVNDDGTQNVYPFEARKAALPLYEGAAIFVDHNYGETPRGYGEKIGRLRNVEAREAGSFGDLHLNPKHLLSEQVAWDAEHSPDSAGLSHAAAGKGRNDGADRVIEEIVNVQSVDLVHSGATTNSLFEGQKAPKANPMDLSTLTVEALTEARADLVEAIRADVAAQNTAQTELTEAKAEAQALRLRVDELELAAKVSARLAKRNDALNSLPAGAVSDVFAEHVRSIESDDEAQKIIEDRQALFLNQTPVSGPTHSPEAEAPDTVDGFLKAVL